MKTYIRQLTSDSYRVRRSFTLVELLVVMGLMAVLMGLASPAFNKIAIGTGTGAGVREVTGVLRQARQYAIARRKKVAVIFPDDAHNFGDSDKPFQSLHVCESEGSNYVFVEGSQWVFISTGAVFRNFTGFEGVSVDTDHNGSANVNNVPAIIFKPTGAVENSSLEFELVEGTYDGNNVVVRNADNAFTITVNQFTGRTQVSGL